MTIKLPFKLTSPNPNCDNVEQRMKATVEKLEKESIEDVPKFLADTESVMSIINPPRGIETFLNWCKKLIRDMKNVMAKA
ncbi:hypothetical protein LR48_Vigan327s000100 [Vigna angularis]|uniref:Uncharacterized protein n=1 Tax=Phaseolus angularis TaxID=3914 RepID=A0A0L9T8G8_PHAAN|nr:hypothetical protein LR48_Vigan327s000100 [Vigna angularis]